MPSRPKPKTLTLNTVLTAATLGVLASTNAKTRQPQLKQGYQQAAQQAQARFLADGFTQTLPDSEQMWLDWAT
jgi:flagellar biosynthesis/type III secretory pathway protein FliH